ncbi:MAG: regulatory protein RecX [Candidatus Omnitrophota bacterium]|jgi:regulatory protein
MCPLIADSSAAKEYAFFLLKFRLRSEKELYERLKKKKFPEGEIKKVIAFLKEKKFIDDRVFVKAWVSSRLRQSIGLKRIRQELRQKGVVKEVIEDKLGELKGTYSESEIVGNLASDRLIKLKDVEPLKAKSRVYGYLIRRGFSPDIVIDTLNKLCKQTA